MATSLPGTYNFAAYRGDTRELTLTFADTSTPPAPVDMSAWTWEAQIRATKDEPDSVIATITVDDADANIGTLVLTLSADESANLVTGEAAGFASGKATYFWDLQGTQGAVVKTWLAGKVSVTGDVTVTA